MKISKFIKGEWIERDFHEIMKLKVYERITGKLLGVIPSDGELWYDEGVRGYYTGCAIIRDAYERGFENEGKFVKGAWIETDLTVIMDLEYEEAIKRAEMSSHDPYDVLISELEGYNDLAREAEEYLEEYFILPDEYWIGSTEDGSFGIWPNEEEDDSE